MSGDNNCFKWVVFYKWKGNFYKKIVVASNESEAEEIAVKNLIDEGKGTDCFLIAIVPELSDYPFL